MIWILLTAFWVLTASTYDGEKPLMLRIALIASAVVLLLDAVQRIRKMKRGDNDAENA